MATSVGGLHGPEQRPPSTAPAAERADRDDVTLAAGLAVAHDQRSALGWTALAAAAAIVWIVMPVGVGILLGTLLAFMVQPVFERLVPRLGKRGSALATVIGSTVALVGIFGGLASLFVARGTVLTGELIASLGPGAEGGGALEAVGRYTTKIGIPPQELTSRARALAGTAAVRAESFAEDLVATTAGGLLALFFAMLSLHFILRNWEVVLRRAQETFPLRPDYTTKLFTEFRRVGRTTLLGTIVTGLAQGVFATLGYWMCGVREPVFFGAATAIASLIPAVGTMIVWVPAGIYLMLEGHPARGVLELVWGSLLVIGVPDYILRPRLVGGDGEVPRLVTFAALFGGVEVFGLKGLIVGPVVMAVALAVLRLYASEARREPMIRIRSTTSSPTA
jgi:predicted PurR-regulated permease PerM